MLFILIFSTLSFPIVQSRIYIVIKIHKLQHNTPCSKRGDTKLMAVALSVLNRFSIFSLQILQKICSNFLLKISPHFICVATLPCEILMSENERQSQTNAVINDELQGITVVTCLRCECGGIFNSLIKKCLLLSLPVKKVLKSVNILCRYGQNGGLCRALSSTFSSVVVRLTKCTRQPILIWF